MKYVFHFLLGIVLVLGDVSVRFFELVAYLFRVIWQLKIVKYNIISYRIYEYPEGGGYLTHSPIGYYPNVYQYLLRKNFKTIPQC